MDHVLPTITQLEGLLAWGPNWNTYDALPPNPQSVSHAKEWISDLCQCVQEWKLKWIAPNVTADCEGDVVFEWRRDCTDISLKRKLTIYVSPDDYVDILQISENRRKEMGYSDTQLSSASDCRRIWKWLVEDQEGIE